MAISRWAPFNALASFDREMQELMDRMVPRRWISGMEWLPSTDMYREDDALVVRAEMPGIAADDIDVEVDGNILHIKGEKKETHEIEETDRYMRECHYGSFERTVMLPEGADVDAVAADYDNGVLFIRIPLLVEEPPAARKVRVSVAADG